ncbi:methyltransferase type 11 [Halalkaliarchaeum desulfuricum]|uniref:Methyltransferase type 11 n=1 Tax=Halalkaliarchaeum desulfuricum TaxID=2055893 RepID=A0A343TI91_9EURY|nr:methyltransferase [Halalkaliarchaeum desulfuricum]AUX08813.1 methyltransferase type 11 [Halalkaliarchaeum desulfuricum]
MSDQSIPGAFYTRWAGVYDRIASDLPGVARMRSAFLDLLSPSRGDVVVEMGCGTGANFPWLRDRVGPEGTVVGVDLSEGVLERARARVRRNRWENVHVVRGDATRPPFVGGPTAVPSGSLGLGAGEVDVVLATFVVGMLPDPGGAVQAWGQLAGDGGRLGLCNLARSTTPLGRVCNPAFAALVRASSPPGGKGRTRGAAQLLDERVLEGHRALHDVCDGVVSRRAFEGFVRMSAGTVRTER